MPHFHCPMCGSHMIRTGKVPITFPHFPVLDRENLALACSYCSCAIEVNPDTSALLEFQGVRLPHLKHPWPMQFVEYTDLTPRGVSVLTRGES